MQRENETRLQYLLRLKAELLLENVVEDDIRQLLGDQEAEKPRPKRGRPANNPPQPPPPARLQIQGGNGNGPAFRNDLGRLPAPPARDGDEES